MGMEENTSGIGEKVSAKSALDGGIVCLVTAARILGIPAEYQQIKRAYSDSGKPLELMDLLRAAKQIELKACLSIVAFTKLAQLPLPVIAVLKNGSYGVMIKANQEKVLFFDPGKERPLLLSQQALEGIWGGQVILLARRVTLAGLSRQFNLKWFIPVVARYKKLFAEVLVASFFLQIFGLITPLFSQVISDKVLVHKGVSTLDILAIGLFLITIFEGVMGTLRSYLFSHTTNRIDVILGAKLFNHLLALPIKYFEIRRVGDTIARMRELDNIRQFITGSALTVVMDLLFGTVFIIVMFFYSVKLSFVALAAIPFFVALSIIVTPIFRERLNHKFACNVESQSYLVESITGIHTLKSLAIEPQMNRKWENLLANYVKASFHTTVLANVAGNIGQCIQKISSLAILWFAAHLVMEGALTVGALIAFQMLSGRVIEPILRLVNT